LATLTAPIWAYFETLKKANRFNITRVSLKKK